MNTRYFQCYLIDVAFEILVFSDNLTFRCQDRSYYLDYTQSFDTLYSSWLLINRAICSETSIKIKTEYDSNSTSSETSNANSYQCKQSIGFKLLPHPWKF